MKILWVILSVLPALGLLAWVGSRVLRELVDTLGGGEFDE